MVAEPYVWHVPALTGASGGKAVREFYVEHFIGQTPDDAVLHPIARTVSENRVIDEFVLEFTHADVVRRSDYVERMLRLHIASPFMSTDRAARST